MSEYEEPIAHMYPSDLARFKSKETYATAYSIAVGNPNEESRPLFSEDVVERLQSKARELDKCLDGCKFSLDTVKKRNARLQAENAELRADAERLSCLMNESGRFYEQGLSYQMAGRLREYIDSAMLAEQDQQDGRE